MKRTLLTGIILFSAISSKAQTPYTTRDSLAKTSVFQGRVRCAALEMARSKIDTSVSPLSIQYAQMVITDAGGDVWLKSMTYGSLSNPVINANSSDGDILFSIKEIFDENAKAYYRDVPEQQ